MTMEIEKDGVTIGQKPLDPPVRKPTFKEKVLGATPAGPKKIVNLVKEGVMTMEYVEGNRLFPRFGMERETYEQMCKPWQGLSSYQTVGEAYRIWCAVRTSQAYLEDDRRI